MKTLSKIMIHGWLLTGFLLSGSQAVAQQGAIQLEHKAEQQQAYVDENGVEQTRMVEAGKVLPGEQLKFTITYTNVGDEPAENVTITNPVPDYMDYVLGSASGDNSAITFSVDGGQNFGNPQELAVTDTEGTRRPAAVEDYTHVRWIIGSDIAPGDSGEVTFSAVVE